MITENKENHDLQAPKEIALRLRQQDSIPVSPIDLTLEKAETMNAEQLQWLNFYEPPLRLTLSNRGDTVMIRGQWPNRHQRPTLFGGPLDGHYVFSHAHFHWNSPSHAHAAHTINGKANTLEMHALFYKSSYHSQAEAQEKEDGIIIVVYFFKVEQRSSFKWMTDQLEQVMAPKVTSQLPPAPLCALMVPFTRDYLAYWGALACTCHHVLWLVSREPLRVTKEELEQFGKVQSNPKEKINNKNIKTVKTANNIYKINPSNDSLEVMFPDAIDPPCQISTKPNKITIAVEYVKVMTSNKTANNDSGGDLNQETCSEVSLRNCTSQEKDTSTSDSDLKNKSQTSESNNQHLCSKCKSHAARLYSVNNKFNHKSSRKRCVVSKRNALESERIANVGKIKMLEKERKRKEVEFIRREEEAARRLLEREKEEIRLIKKALDDELKRIAETCESKETPKCGGVDDEPKSCPRRPRSPIQKSVLTSKPKSVLIDKDNLQSEGENIVANSKSVSDEHGESPENAQSKTIGDQSSIKEEREIKKKADPPKSKLPVRKFTPWRPQEGLKSSLTPYFSSSKGRPTSEKKQDAPGSNLKMSTQIPKFNKRIVNRTKHPQRQDLGGKGDQNVNDTRRAQQKPMGHTVSINYL